MTRREPHPDTVAWCQLVGEHVERVRRSQGLTCEAVAEAMGVSRFCLYHLEAGHTVSLDTLVRAHKWLGVTVALQTPGRQSATPVLQP